ncbi:EAL domain-containing protein [Clostridium sp. Sa3CUN1]|uniref:EAL domain-containing protein n=1 Tax=Clostridium gallinarum TaxID=2762246 RepID=A0ABR8Q6D3_9CLOT|nr:EAL domain-containing protein [Clostridium gallinarum]MBD7915959.1 EAL domain-containing protein [Clostridium gallinarum]
MYNKKVKLNLYKMFFVTILLSMGILFIGTGIIKYIDYARYDTVRNTLSSKVEAYKMQIEMQINSDIQILNTVSSFLRVQNSRDLNDLGDILHKSNKKNHFIGMYSIYTDGTVIESIITKSEASYIRVDEIQPEIREIYERSLNGEIVVSDAFYVDYLKSNVVAVGIPIYDEKEEDIGGALIAYDTSDQFNENLSISIKSDKEKDLVNIIKSNGAFIVRSNERLDETEANSIYNMGIKLLDENEVKSALENREDYYSMFNLDDSNYGVYFKQLSYNNWYLFLVNSINIKDDYMNKILNITRGMFIFIVAIISLFIFLAYFMLKKSNNLLAKLAYYDELTGAYNANEFRNKCEEALKTENNYSIVVFNIKKFKFINSIFGEKWCDELLCYIKDALEKNTYNNEYYCRESADQFFILIKSTNKNEIMERIDKIKSEIQEFPKIKNQNCEITIYGGICNYIKLDDASKIYKTMLDNALFIMKENNENKTSFIFYDDNIYKKIYKQNYIENNMQSSLDNNEFRLFLQPKVDPKINKVIGAEALVRWIKDDGTVIYPNEFIPLFEKNGFCEKLDLYMIEKACQKIRSWIDNNKEAIPISINQSKLTFYKADYIESICKITEKYNVPNSFIVLEILEGLALDNISDFNNTIEKLHKKGFRVSMDDFGSQYSSLNTLSKLKIDEIKIDGEFLLKLEKDKEHKDKQKIILRNIIKLARELNLQTVVEGVEDECHLEFINDLGYDMAQGYYFSKPIDEKSFDAKYMS